MSKQQQFLKEFTSKALLNLSITYRSGNIDAFREKISVSLSHADNQMFRGFDSLISLKLNPGFGKDLPCIEAILEDESGNQVVWDARYVNESESPKGPFRLKGGLVVSKLGIEEPSNLASEV